MSKASGTIMEETPTRERKFHRPESCRPTSHKKTVTNTLSPPKREFRKSVSPQKSLHETPRSLPQTSTNPTPTPTKTLILHMCELKRMVDPRMVMLRELETPRKKKSRSVMQTPRKSLNTSELASSAMKYGSYVKVQKEAELEARWNVSGSPSPNDFKLDLGSKHNTSLFAKPGERRGSRLMDPHAFKLPVSRNNGGDSSRRHSREAISIQHSQRRRSFQASEFGGKMNSRRYKGSEDGETEDSSVFSEIAYDDVILVPRFLEQPEVVLQAALSKPSILEKELQVLKIWQKNLELEDRKAVEVERTVFPTTQWISDLKISKRMDGLFGDMEDKKRRLRPAEEATIMGVIERMLEESIKDPDFLMNNLATCMHKILRRAGYDYLHEFPTCMKQVELHFKIFLTRFRCSEVYHKHEKKLKNAMEWAETRGLLLKLGQKSPIVNYLMKGAIWRNTSQNADEIKRAPFPLNSQRVK